MDLPAFIQRDPSPEPWAEGDHIPWNDPGFSQRMLREHLSQDHDAASRRAEIIDKHVQWIHRDLLERQPTRILDLGCGPGLYTSRLARLGHTCTGIDFSPASIQYARQQAEKEALACTYIQEDLRRVSFGEEEQFGLVMLIFGEFNVFKPVDAAVILNQAYHVLVPGGLLLLEPHPLTTIQKIGQEAPSWRTMHSGLFSDQPHIYLEESFWDNQRRAATNRYWVIEAGSCLVERYASSYQAYTHEEYRLLLEQHRFQDVQFFPSLAGRPGEPETDLIAITARKL